MYLFLISFCFLLTPDVSQASLHAVKSSYVDPTPWSVGANNPYFPDEWTTKSDKKGCCDPQNKECLSAQREKGDEPNVCPAPVTKEKTQ
jgi:hypothetical protein